MSDPGINEAYARQRARAAEAERRLALAREALRGIAEHEADDRTAREALAALDGEGGK